MGLAAVLLLSFLLMSSIDRKTKRKLAHLTRDRPSLDDNAFYDLSFADSGIPRDVVAGVRAIFRENIPADLSALGADDDFSGNFQVIWMLDSMSSVEVVVGLEKAFGITIEDSEAERVTSIRKAVELVWSKLPTSTREQSA
ncbi:acyl carrier protein [Terrimicrobium sacchariphilum]|uniref:Acyl carrier protein n=2 Tax=Terrimicrobium sacchariphilum TaxID=690879 RepID=A0A146G8Y7_TERSA|nr:acyl carrier protein [Terrimicrobium sacchariphilum]